MKKCAMCAILFFLFLEYMPAAKATAVIDAQASVLGMEELEEASMGYGGTFSEGINLEAGLSELWESGKTMLFNLVKDGVRSGLFLLLAVLTGGLAGSFQKDRMGIETVDLVTVLSVTGIAVTDVESLLRQGSEAISNMAGFSKVMLPTLSAAVAASGYPAAAAARNVTSMLVSDFMMTALDQILIPLLYAYLATQIAYAAIGNEGMIRMAKFLKWGVVTALSLLLFGFTGYLTVSGAIAGSADAAAVKAAKFAVSGAVPVVGGILSDASETILASAGILKNSIGIFGMLTVLGMCIGPFLSLGVHYLLYKGTAALAATVAEGRVSGLIDGIGGGFGILLGMCGTSALLLLVSVVSAIQISAS